MAQREAYVPPVRQSSPAPGSNSNGNQTPQSDGTTTDELPSSPRQIQLHHTTIVNDVSPVGSHQPQQPAAQPRPNFNRKAYDTPDNKMYYICAACNTTSGFKANDALRCFNCGGSTMHKPRVKRCAIPLVVWELEG